MSMKNYNKDKRENLAKAILKTIDEVRFEKHLQDFREGKSDASIRIPTASEIDAMFRKHTGENEAYNSVSVFGSFVKIPEVLRQGIHELVAVFGFIPYPIAVASKKDLKSIKVPYKGEEVEVYFILLAGEQEIEIYTSEKSLIGKSFVIRDKNEEILIKCEFEEDDTAEGMKASSFFNVPKIQAEKINLENIASLEVGIEE